MKSIKLIIIGYVFCFLCGCSNEVDFGEQYKKQVYIVNANDKIVKKEYGLVEKTNDFVTFYCSGTKPSGSDIVVNYAVDTNALNQFNKSEYGEESKVLYLVKFPEKFVTFREPAVTIKAGEEFGTLHFSISTMDLEPGVRYAIPISITEVSSEEINPKMKTLFYQVSVNQNAYSGTYNCRQKIGWDWIPVDIEKKATAVSKKGIRLPIMNRTEVPEGNNNYYEARINDDNSVTLTSPLSAFVPLTFEFLTIDGVKYKNQSYDPEKKSFLVSYTYSGTAYWEILTFKE